MSTERQPQRILVIRRDNIGDLVCTTPLFACLKSHYPQARIMALVNSYNAAVLEGNPHVDHLYVYTKAKHRGDQLLWRIYWQRFRLTRALRQQVIDLAILATPSPDKYGYRLARQIGARRIIGMNDGSLKLDVNVPPADIQGLHQVQRTLAIAGLSVEEHLIPPVKVFVSAEEKQQARQQFQQAGGVDPQPIGIHISARKVVNRWPTTHFVSVIRKLLRTTDKNIVLFWSPGSENNAQHPGDDEKASAIIQQINNPRLIPFPTLTLRALIAGLSPLSVLLCSDGGAMHITAGLARPIVCLFGYSEGARQWRPWGKHTLLQQEPVDQITPDAAFNALLPYLSESTETGQISKK